METIKLLNVLSFFYVVAGFTYMLMRYLHELGGNSLIAYSIVVVWLSTVILNYVNRTNERESDENGD